MNASPLRYFLVVGLHAPHSLAVLAGVTILGLWTVGVSTTELDSSLGLLLFVQMFLASTGFVARARRGHFDPILASPSTRTAVVCAHWLVSAAPGLLAWATVTVAASAMGAALVPAIAGRRLVALLMVSATAWAGGFRLSRGAAGALWTAALLALLLDRGNLLGSSAATIAAATPWLVLRHAAALVVCPFLLLGTPAPLAPGAVPAAACITAAFLLAIWRSAEGLDVYLRDRA